MEQSPMIRFDASSHLSYYANLWSQQITMEKIWIDMYPYPLRSALAVLTICGTLHLEIPSWAYSLVGSSCMQGATFFDLQENISNQSKVRCNAERKKKPGNISRRITIGEYAVSLSYKGNERYHIIYFGIQCRERYHIISYISNKECHKIHHIILLHIVTCITVHKQYYGQYMYNSQTSNSGRKYRNIR